MINTVFAFLIGIVVGWLGRSLISLYNYRSVPRETPIELPKVKSTGINIDVDGKPQKRVTVTYYGEPVFDTSFIIENANGDFLGEFGLGFGTQTPDGKVESIDIWLFDKANINTVTSILVSPDTFYRNMTAMNRLRIKGDVVLAERRELVLTTQKLTVNVRIVELEFVAGYFAKLVVEFSVPETVP